MIVPRLQSFVVGWGFWPTWAVNWMKSDKGPFTIFFWCPLMKWMISVGNIYDMQKPPELINTKQQCVIVLTGTLFTRWVFTLTPRVYMLAACNAAMATTGVYQLIRQQKAGLLF